MSSIPEHARREIGQHFVFGFHGYEVSSDIETLIRDYFVGNVILFKRNVHSITQVHTLTRRLQQIAKDAGHATPLLIGIDQENGLVSAFSPAGDEAGTQFPGAMAIAAVGDVQAAKEVATASAEELKVAGINWVYSPVADINSDPRNPVIGVRSYGDNPQVAAEYTRAVSDGIVSSGVASCAKHFPGHGDTHVDSHLALPMIRKSRSNLDKTELVPFRTLIAAGIPSIMTAHIIIPELTGEEPASLSRAATHGLLRHELEFQGLIVTDCLEMEAIAGTVGTSDGAVQALQAGADVVMICHRIDRHIGALKAAYNALEEGRLNIDELLSSGARVADVKAKFAGTWKDVIEGSLDSSVVAELKRAHIDLAKQTYARTTALVAHSTPSILPLRPGKLVHLYVPRSESVNAAVDDPNQIRNTLGPTYAGFGEALERRLGPDCFKLSVYSSALVDPPIVSGAIVFTTQNAHTKTWQVEALQTLLDSVPIDTPVILVSSCGPYDLAMLHSAVEGKSISYASLATFEFTAPAFEAASEVLFGEHAASGTMPVSLC